MTDRTFASLEQHSLATLFTGHSETSTTHPAVSRAVEAAKRQLNNTTPAAFNN
jgi:hypothetical protein